MAFRHSPAGDIQQLKELLKEQYRDLASVLIEAIQNADDAGADRMAIGVVDGVPGTGHPLLGDPALVILNNGVFQFGDQRGICELNFGTKGGVAERIGRFGLGLKSIFHLGECFWFSASPDQPDMRPGRDGKSGPWLLNPWWDDGHQEGWYDSWSSAYASGDTAGRLQGRMTELAAAASFSGPWFGLWVPLRRASHIVTGNRLSDRDGGDAIPAVVSELGGSLARTRLLTALPLLRKVSWIRFLGSPADPTSAWTIEVESGSSRRSGLSQINEAALDGEITSNFGANEECIAYRGSEQRIRPDDPRVCALLDDPLWPQVSMVQGGTLTTGKDRSDAHGAVIILARRIALGGARRLVITQAANTPLTELTESITDLPRANAWGWEVHLILHGEYFVDSGRRHLGMDGHSVRGRWNTLIRTAAMSPQLLPTLHRAITAESGQGSSPDWSWLVAAIASSKAWMSCRAAATANASLVLSMDAGDGAWRLLTSDAPALLRLPPGIDGRRLFKELPGTQALAKELTLISGDAEALAASPPIPWTDATAACVLSQPAEDLGREPASLQMLASLLAAMRHDNAIDARTRSALGPCLAVVLGNQPEGALTTERREALLSIIRELPPTARWILDTPDLGSRQARTVARMVGEALPGLVVIPRLLAEVGKVLENPPLNLTQAETLLRRLSQPDIATIDQHGKVLAAAVRDVVLASAADDRPALLDRIADIPWIRVRARSAASEHQRLPWSEVELQAASELVVRWTNFSKEQELISTLRVVLAEDRLIAVEDDAYAEVYKVFRGDGVPICNEKFCANAINTYRLTQDAGRRVAMLDRLKSYGDRLALRHLLHGVWDHRKDSATPLLVLSLQTDTDVVSRLLRAFLDTTKTAWTLVDRRLGMRLSPAEMAELKSSQAENQAISDCYSNQPQILKTLVEGCSDDERLELQRVILDRTTALALPIWATTDGRWVPIDSQRAHRDPRHRIVGTSLSPMALGLDIIVDPADLHGRQVVEDTVPTLTPPMLLQRMLTSADPHQWFDYILDFWAEMPSGHSEVADRIDRTPWVRLADGTAGALLDLVPVPELAPWINPVRDSGKSRLWSQDQIDSSDWDKLRNSKLIKSDSKAKLDGLRRVVESLRNEENMEFGPKFNGMLSLDDITAVVNGCDKDSPKAWQLIACAMRDRSLAEKGDDILNTVITHLSASFPIPTVKTTLQAMEQAWTNSSRSVRDSLLKVLAWLLAGLDDRRRTEAISGMRLPNSQGDWRPTRDLCAGWRGIDPAQQVHVELERVWATLSGGSELAPQQLLTTGSAHFAEGITYEEAIKQSLAIVEQYFKPWQERVPDSAIGGFIALLDDHSSVMEYAQRWLGPTAKPACEIRADLLDLSAVAGAGNASHGRVGTILIEVVAADTRTAKAQAVDGSVMHARLMANGGTPILVHDRRRTMDKTRVLRDANGLPIHVIQARLHAIDPGPLTREVLIVALRDAAEAMLSLLWSIGLHRENWAKICQREQQAMRVLERVMLPKAMVQLEQLRLRSSSAIRAILNEWRIYQHQRASNSKTLTPTLEDEILDRLHEALTNEPVEVLRAIRDHIGPTHFQYSQTSIPFELVQNADDAISEEVWLRQQAGKVDQPLRGITLWQENDVLAIIHHGRQINRCRRGSFEATHKGFDRDLEKMLSISVSDKDGHGGIAVTGRFGLGFKSCYLITDRPEILSGEYDFRIQAGMIPLPIAAEDIHRARDIRDAHAADQVNATVIVLQARKEIELAQVMVRLVDLAVWLPLTLRAADAVEIKIRGQPDQRWKHRIRFQSSDGSVAVLDLGESGRQALVLGKLDDPTRRILVMAFNRQGPAPLPDDVPGLWVTTPLKQADGHGFFVNGPFMVDVGRGQIAIDVQTHDTVVGELRDILRQALESLWQLVWDDDAWLNLVEKSGMSHELVDDRAKFCSSLLGVLSKPFTHNDGGHPLLRLILWGTEADSGVVPKLLLRDGKLPSNLPPPVPPLVELNGLKWVVEPDLVKIIGSQSNTDWVTKCVAQDSPGHRVALLMGKRLSKLELSSAFGLDANGTTVRPEVAQAICDSLSRLAVDNQRRSAFVSALRMMAVRTRADTEPIIGDSALLLPVDAQCERWLRLAPQEFVIADGYPEEFCLLLRSAGCRPVSANVMAGLILGAPVERHDDAMDCLEVAGFDVQQIVERQARGTWLGEIAHQEGSRHAVAKSILQRGLSTAASAGQGETSQHSAPRDAWQRIRDWWVSDGASFLHKWEQDTYPQGKLQLTWDVENEANRLAWMTLFSIASAQRMGRTNAHQHRTFVDRMIQRGWLRLLSEPGQRHQHLDKVIRELVDEYDTAIQSAEYTSWWELIVPIAIFGGSLDAYVNAFNELRKHIDPGSVDTWFSPRIQPLLQGVTDAPPIRGLLGIGCHVVIREMVRRGLCQPEPLASYCWVPHARVLRVVGWLTGQAPTDPTDRRQASRWIADRIAKHIEPAWTFDGCFDIPLQLLAQDQKLQQRVLGMTIPDEHTEKD